MSVTDEQLDAWERLAGDATWGPWEARDGWEIWDRLNLIAAIWGTEGGQSVSEQDAADAAFIVAAQVAVPALCSALREARGEIARLRAALEHALRENEELAHLVVGPFTREQIAEAQGWAEVPSVGMASRLREFHAAYEAWQAADADFSAAHKEYRLRKERGDPDIDDAVEASHRAAVEERTAKDRWRAARAALGAGERGGGVTT